MKEQSVIPGMKSKNFFICDPAKNVKCRGRFQPHCTHQCFCTTNPSYSSNPDHALTTDEYYREEGIRMKIIR